MARSTTTRSAAGLGCARTKADDDAGFSLVEALVSFTLFIIISGFATLALVNLIQVTSVSRDRTAASNLAAQEIEKMRSQSFTGHQVDSAAFTVSEHNVTFTVTPTANPAISTACATGSKRQVSVVVSWSAMAKTRSTRYDAGAGMLTRSRCRGQRGGRSKGMMHWLKPTTATMPRRKPWLSLSFTTSMHDPAGHQPEVAGIGRNFHVGDPVDHLVAGRRRRPS